MKRFGGRGSIALWRTGLTALAIVACAAVAKSSAAEATPGGGQSTLDLIAGVPFDNTFKELGASPPTGPFSSWTADQRRSVPADIQKLCAGFWTFIDGAPGSRVLPASLPPADEVALVMDVCLIAHMPTDWPERGARLQSATAILKRANQAGAQLHLPVQLTR